MDWKNFLPKIVIKAKIYGKLKYLLIKILAKTINQGSFMEILDRYITSFPCEQNALDIFKNEWASRLPEPFAQLAAGNIPLFEDGRINWCVKSLGGIQGQTILELGPLEAGHTYMLEKKGAASILSIEANTRAYLKCLIIKEILDLKRAKFICGDFVKYLQNCATKFDVCIASGVLYHMTNPVELLSLISQVTDKIFIWTHYYDRDLLAANPHKIAKKFPSSISAEYNGFKHTLYRYEYLTALADPGFCGGSQAFSYWMSRGDILAALEYLGFNEIRINFEKPDHPNGPSFAVLAIRN